MEYLMHPKALPIAMLVFGVLLIVVPKWLRLAIAVVMIALGLAGLFPELVNPPVAT